ncbi:myb-like protein X [Vespula squamosa]|uniref:Myb-like protein X n=1 Tax=Vespula squamosa TaxID=30214 RepID=A0ABD2BXV4_VESSQ
MLVLKARLTRKKETKFIMAVTTNFDETNMTLIRKSASLAGGYNRLSLERLSEDRLKMQAERGSNWNFSSNKRHLILESILFVKRGCKIARELSASRCINIGKHIQNCL